MEKLWRKSLNFTYTNEIILQQNLFQKNNSDAYLEKKNYFIVRLLH